ncbi:hypothetical protein QVD17_35640 [Tagetes erecta]|uniref:Membrane-associated kinase regulator 2 n=1 Tax=Tagetes erecta TaxID=13708 RepID=A0AAD8JQW0_TARER|nr:hypothetical protein QVD17_35640 [Tagetes erecta]
MDVFSLVKFWRNAAIGDPADFDLSDDEASFFDLVFTTPNNTHSVNVISHFQKVDALTPQTTSSNTKSPFRVLMLGLKPEKKEEGTTTISSLLKREDNTQSKRDLVHRYLNLIKPLYIKVSRSRSNHKSPSFFTSRKEEKPASGRTVFKHLGKSRSSSSSSSVVPRRDDSALQQQDGIQSAILHCKNSYNSPNSQGCNVLSRSGSAPSAAGCRISIHEPKRTSI